MKEPKKNIKDVAAKIIAKKEGVTQQTAKMDLMEEADLVDPSNIPFVQLPQENKVIVSSFIIEIVKLLKPTDCFFRVADNSVVEIINNEMRTVTSARMVSLIETVCIPCIEVYNKYTKNDELHKKSASEQLCKILLASPVLQNGLKRIEKILSVPIPILKDGKIVFPKKKYNPDLKLWLNINAPEITNPNMKLEDAKKILGDIFEEFCFKDDLEEDKTKALLALLTPYLRGVYASWNVRTPVFIYFANRERAGKDYLAAIRILVFEGAATEEPPISTGKKDGGSNDELRKKFLSTLMKGSGFMHFSNNKGFIDNATFEQFATAAVYEDRILGKNDMAAFENNIELSLSANTGTTMTADLGHRSIIINLFLGMEDINKRKFNKPNLHEEIKKDRGLILSALYCLVMNWADRYMVEGTELFSSFPEWAKIGGGILEAAGYINPLKNVEIEEVGMDDETTDMKTFFEFMHEHYADEWKNKTELRNIILDDDELGSSIFGWMDLSNTPGKIKFGFLIDKYSGRVFDSVLMKRDETVKRKSRQKIIFTKVKIEDEDVK